MQVTHDKSQFSSSNSTCSSSNFTQKEFTSLTLALSSSGAVCFVISCVITLLLLISKSYHTVLQRLLLYLMVATVLCEIILAATFEHLFHFPEQVTICSWKAFVYNWTNILRIVFTTGIVIYLFFLVRYLAKGITIPQFLHSSSRRTALEVLYAVASPAVTLLYSSVPLFTHSYGLDGPWCWIRMLDEDCKVTLSGLLNQLFQGYIWNLPSGVIGGILVIAVAIVYCRLPSTLKDSRHLLKRTFAVMVCFVVYVAIQTTGLTIGLSYGFSTATATSNKLWFTYGIVLPISFLLFPVTFILSFYPIMKLCRSTPCARALKHCCCHRGVQKPSRHIQEQMENSHKAPTFCDSSRVSPPSHTFFSIPYTNEFTQVSSENTPLVHSDKEAMSDGSLRDNVGYGSVRHQQQFQESEIL